MNQLKNLQRAQVLISCGILTGVWSNLYVNVKSKCPHFNKCPVSGKNNVSKINNNPIDDTEIRNIFKNN